MKAYHTILFDLDGTLMDTSPGVLQAIDHIAQTHGLPALTEKERYACIGPPIQTSLQKYYKLTAEQAWELAIDWRNAYKDRFLFEATPYAGIYTLLGRCREQGFKTAVATNKREDYTVPLLEHFQFLSLFDCVVGSDFAGKRNKTGIIRLCIEQIGEGKTEHCLMIGDTIGDKIGAKEAGIDFLGVTYGFGFRRGEYLPEGEIVAMVDSCDEIQRVLGLLR